MADNVVSELAISLPFKIDAFGTVGATNDQSKIWADRARSVIGTALGERVYRPNFGCEAAASIYESEELVLSTIDADIRSAFTTYLALLSIIDVLVSVDEYTRVITAEIRYATPTAAEYLIKVGLATIDGNNTIQEDISWQIQ
jgi:phage baseplate assembly protein W